MVKNSFQRLKTFIQSRPVGGILITSVSVVLGAGLYYNKTRRKTFTFHQQSQPANPTATRKDGWAKSFSTDASGNSTNTRWDDNWDRRNPKSLVKPPKTEENREAYQERVKRKTPSVTRHLILIRHGDFNNIDASDDVRTLTPLGQEQSELTGQYLHDIGLNFTRIVSSTLLRAVETADIIHKYLPSLRLDRDDILCEGRPVLPEPELSWRPDHVYFQDGARIEAAFRKYFHRADPEQSSDSVEILVCHAHVIRYFVCRALQFPPEAWQRIALPHASVTHVIVRPSGNVYLQGLGSVGHIPPNKVTLSARGQELLP